MLDLIPTAMVSPHCAKDLGASSRKIVLEHVSHWSGSPQGNLTFPATSAS